ncbi:MAG: helix-turn-helix transcriptional regulator [Microgenomates group bacterium]
MKNYTNWADHKKELLKDYRFVKALQETALEYQIARAIIAARLDKGLTQTELAQRLDTKQSVISRVENAKTTPSLSFLRRVASALDTQVDVQFKRIPPIA